jgi:hypothetical protein
VVEQILYNDSVFEARRSKAHRHYQVRTAVKWNLRCGSARINGTGVWVSLALSCSQENSQATRTCTTVFKKRPNFLNSAPTSIERALRLLSAPSVCLVKQLKCLCKIFTKFAAKFHTHTHTHTNTLFFKLFHCHFCIVISLLYSLKSLHNS